MQRGMIVVGMADLNVTRAPGTLTTLGLGSCVGIALYDPATKIAGLAHIMLPDSKAIHNNSNVAKFADTAIVKMIADMERLGARRANITAKIAGGAHLIFPCLQSVLLLLCPQILLHLNYCVSALSLAA